MMTRLLPVLTLMVLCVQGQTKRAITHEDVWLMKRVGEPVVSPDGKWILFSLVEPDYDASKQVSDLWVVPADGTQPARRLTSTKAPESGAVWSPDGKSIAFAARRDGDEATQIYVLPFDGGEARRVTNQPGGASSPQWSPNGNAILFESDFDPIATERRARKYNARAYDTFPIRYWNAWLDGKKAHVFVQDLTTPDAKPVDILKGSKLADSKGFSGLFNPTGGGTTLQPVWTPDGISVVFAAQTNLDQTMSEAVESHLFLASASGGAEPVLLDGKGHSLSSPQFSSTGELYALHQRNPVRGGRLYSLNRLAKLNWRTPGAPVLLTERWDRSVGGFSVSKDGRTIYMDAEDDGFDQLFSMPAAGGEVKRLLKVERGGYSSIRPVDGGLIARFQTGAQPPEIVRLKDGGHALLTNFNGERLAQLDTPESVHFWFTAKNGKRIHSVLNLPPAFSPAKKYPLVVFPHGGPNAMSKDAFSTRWNSYLLTSPGYVLLQTNYTGSTGFGEKFADDIERDVLRGPAQEILEAMDEAARRFSYIDPTRAAAAGASYGGYLMNWFAGNTDRFKCLVNHAGAINNESQYGTNDGGLERELRMGGPVWEHGGQWMDQSPIRYSGKFATPMLITQGELDFRVPMSESMTTFKLLQRRHVPARLILFPDEGHWILKGENSRYHMQEVLGWLKEYLK